MSENLPWDNIKKPSNAEFYVRMVSDTKGIPLFWGKDGMGRCLFIIKLSGDQSKLFEQEIVQAQGMKLDLRSAGTDGLQNMIITLEKHVNRDLFFAMCKTLIFTLKDINESATALSFALKQIKRWKAFMAGRWKLSSKEIRGLFGELTFLLKMMNRLNEHVALNSWNRPKPDQQDFSFGDMAVEIKTLSGKERNSVHISSEDQLFSLSGKLFLKIYRLSAMQESDGAISLNKLIKQVAERISDPSMSEMFNNKLVASGYTELHEYDNPKFIVSEERLYCVTNDFPKLIRTELPEGISNVHYEIKLEKIENFLAKNNFLWEK